MQLLIKVHLFKSPFVVCCVYYDCVTLPDSESCKAIGIKCDIRNSKTGDGTEIKREQNLPVIKHKQKILKLSTTAIFLQPFLKECANSDVYRKNLILYLNRRCDYPKSGTIFLKLILEPPDKEVIDYAWNARILRLVWTKVEIENAFSWLSTLGGAYSALGDYFQHCADEAGKISMRQYRLSKMLGDDSLAARSRLYSAIAYAQKGCLRLSRHIVRNIAAFARQTQDIRLNRMCQGVWVKLKYLQDIQNEHLENGKLKVNNKHNVL